MDVQDDQICRSQETGCVQEDAWRKANKGKMEVSMLVSRMEDKGRRRQKGVTNKHLVGGGRHVSGLQHLSLYLRRHPAPDLKLQRAGLEVGAVRQGQETGIW